jgi:hypothetical protein
MIWRNTKVKLSHYSSLHSRQVETSWNVTAHGDAWEGKWRGNWRMEWVVSTRHTTSEHGVSSITTADVHTSAASSRLNWRPRRFKWTRPFRRKTKYGFCAFAITFQTQSKSVSQSYEGSKQKWQEVKRIKMFLTVEKSEIFVENRRPLNLVAAINLRSFIVKAVVIATQLQQ